MADDQNKSNKRIPNTLSGRLPDSIDESPLQSGLERTSEQRRRKSAQHEQLENALREDGRRFNELISIKKNHPQYAGPFVNEALSSLQSDMAERKEKLRAMEQAADIRQTMQSSNLASRLFSDSAISGRASTASRNPSIQNRAFKYMNMSEDEMQERRTQIMGEIRSTETDIQRIIKNDLFYKRGKDRGIVIPETSAHLGVYEGSIEDKVNELAELNAANHIKKSNKTDSTSRLRHISDMGAKAESFLENRNLLNEIKNGSISLGGDQGNIPLHKVNAEITKWSETLTKSLKDLAEAAEQGTEGLEVHREKAEEASDILSKLFKVRDGGGGDIVSGKLRAIGGGANALGSVTQEIAVNQRLAQMSNIAGFAGIENLKYDTYRKAQAGDVMSQMMLSQFGDAEEFGKELGVGAIAATGLNAVGGVANAAAGVVDFKTSFTPGGKINAGLNIVQGVGSAAASSANLMRRINESSATIQGTLSSVEAKRALMQISATQLQGFRDYSVGGINAARSLGGDAGAQFLSNSIDDGNMQNLVNARIGPEEFNKMAAFGADSMGSMFRSGQIFSAQGLARSGIGTMETNMQRMSMLAQAGSNNPETGLASVLEAAFSRGLKSSEALNEIAKNTAGIISSSNLQMSGGDITHSAASLLAAGVNTSLPNQEFAVRRAMDARQRMAEIGQGTSMSFADMLATSRMASMTGTSIEEGIRMQSWGDADLMRLSELPNEQIREHALNIGVRFKEGEEQASIKKAMRARLLTNVQGGAAGIGTNIDAERVASLIEQKAGWDTLSADDQYMLGAAATHAGFKGGGREFYTTGGGIMTPRANESIVSSVKDAMAGEGGSDTMKSLHDMSTQGQKQMAAAALEATKFFSTANDAIKALSILSKEVEKQVDGGAEEKFKMSAAEASKTFGASTVKFETAVTEFSKAVDKITNKERIDNSAKARREATEALLDGAANQIRRAMGQ